MLVLDWGSGGAREGNGLVGGRGRVPVFLSEFIEVEFFYGGGGCAEEWEEGNDEDL